MPDIDTLTVNYVVVGTGSIGLRHLRLLHQSFEGQVAAMPIRSERRTLLTEQGFRVVASWEEAARLGIRYAVIATDTACHPTGIEAAAKAGCDVLVEKPLAVDSQVARMAMNVAISLERKVWVGCCLRFQSAMNDFRHFLTHVGKVYSVRIECQSYLPDWRPDRPYRDSYSARAGEGGVLRDLIHEIDYATWLFGWPRAVQAKIRNLERLGIEAEETADLLWETDDGVLVSMSLDYLSRPSRRRMRVVGEQGSLEWDGITHVVTLAMAGQAEQVFHSPQSHDEMYLAQDLAFIESSRTSPDPRLATGEDGVRALAICDAARRAAESRCEVEVEYP